MRVPRRQPRAVYTVCDADELFAEDEAVELEAGAGAEADTAESAIGDAEGPAPSRQGGVAPRGEEGAAAGRKQGVPVGRVLVGMLACAAASCLCAAVAVVLVRLLDGALAGSGAGAHRQTAHLAAPPAASSSRRALPAASAARPRGPIADRRAAGRLASTAGGLAPAGGRTSAKTVSAQRSADARTGSPATLPAAPTTLPAAPAPPASPCSCGVSLFEFGFER